MYIGLFSLACDRRGGLPMHKRTLSQLSGASSTDLQQLREAFVRSCGSVWNKSPRLLQQLLRLPNSPLHLAGNVLQPRHAVQVLLCLQTLSAHALLVETLRLLGLVLCQALLRFFDGVSVQPVCVYAVFSGGGWERARARERERQKSPSCRVWRQKSPSCLDKRQKSPRDGK